MSDKSSQIKQEVANEQLRLTVAIAIIAATIGLFSLDIDKYGSAIILQVFVLSPSLLLGMYIIFTAARLKYKRPAEIGDLSVPEKVRRGCYDLGVNLFWTMFLIFVFILFASLFGWSGEMEKFLDFWPSFIVAFIVLLILIVVLALMSGNESTKKHKPKLFRGRK